MDSLPQLVLRIEALQTGMTILVIDDNSPDGTGAWAQSQADTGRLNVIHRPGKLGLGTAHLAGFRRALADGFDPILTMDSDLSHPPEVIPTMIDHMGESDLAIGSRYVPGGGTKHWPLSRVALSRGANLFAKTLLRLKSSDCTAAYRCWSAGLLRKIPLDHIKADGYSFMVETVCLAERAGARIREVPIVFEDRRFGESKISKSEIRKAIWTVFRLAIRR